MEHKHEGSGNMKITQKISYDPETELPPPAFLETLSRHDYAEQKAMIENSNLPYQETFLEVCRAIQVGKHVYVCFY